MYEYMLNNTTAYIIDSLNSLTLYCWCLILQMLQRYGCWVWIQCERCCQKRLAQTGFGGSLFWTFEWTPSRTQEFVWILHFQHFLNHQSETQCRLSRLSYILWRKKTNYIDKTF